MFLQWNTVVASGWELRRGLPLLPVLGVTCCFQCFLGLDPSRLVGGWEVVIQQKLWIT